MNNQLKKQFSKPVSNLISVRKPIS